MKATFIGGGAHRVLGILRATLAQQGVLDGGEVYLHDLNIPRAEALGRILMKTPEYQRNPITVRWGNDLDQALEGADVVSVILMAGSNHSYFFSNSACLRHGFLGTDNISPSGSFLAMKGAPILLDIAHRMEHLCPEAWLIDFANPVAVLSGMINRHTRIRSLGVCAGFTNHQWDLARIFGRDEQSSEFHVTAAGVNHLSFIMDGTRQGRDLFTELDALLLHGDWQPLTIAGYSEKSAADMRLGIEKLVALYREHHFMVFSTEPDGSCHFYYDEEVQSCTQYDDAELTKMIHEGNERRNVVNGVFEAHANQELDAAFWAQPRLLNDPLAPLQDDIFIRVIRGISGVEPVEIVSSRLNHGAIEGIEDDHVVEYSQRLYGKEIRPAGCFRLPAVAQGLIHGIAHHQTLLGDACFTGDPKLLAVALKAYPVKAFTPESRALYRELFAINQEEIPVSLREGVKEFQ